MTPPAPPNASVTLIRRLIKANQKTDPVALTHEELSKLLAFLAWEVRQWAALNVVLGLDALAQPDAAIEAVATATARACRLCPACGSMQPPKDWTWCECEQESSDV